MGLGLLGLGYGFLSVPSTVEEAKSMMASHGEGHGEEHDSSAHNLQDHPTLAEAHHGTDSSDTHADAQSHMADADAHNDHNAHDKHVFDQMRNRPWSAFYVSALFSFLIALGVLAFYAINRAAQAGWSPLLFRVMEGITSYLIPG